MAGFRECINCEWVTCTVWNLCVAKLREENPQHTKVLLEIESITVSQKKRQQEYAIRAAQKAERRRHHFFARVPLSGYARRRRKNGQYGRFYNYLHMGRWHGFMRFLKSH